MSLASTTRVSSLVAKWCLGYAPRVLLHAANLWHGTNNFTSLPKESVLRILRAEDFYRPLKIQRLRPGLNPRTWVSEASTLPLHHRSRYVSPLGLAVQRRIIARWINSKVERLWSDEVEASLRHSLGVVWRKSRKTPKLVSRSKFEAKIMQGRNRSSAHSPCSYMTYAYT